MKDFFSILRTYAWPYKGYLIGSLVFNLLSAVLNVFSFMSLMPMLQLLFGINKGTYPSAKADMEAQKAEEFERGMMAGVFTSM